jgi:PAS domain S-box-containing protein
LVSGLEKYVMAQKFSYEELEQKVIEFEKKQTDLIHALEESRSQLNLLTDQTILAIAIIQNDKIVYANNAYSQLTGYALDEILTWTTQDTLKLIHPDYQGFVISQAQKKMKGEKTGVVKHYQYIGIQKTGETQWVDQFSQTVIYKGLPADMVSLININEQINARRKLKESEEKYRLLVDHANDSILILQDGRIQFCNPSVYRETGFPTEELAGKPFIDLVHPDDREMVIDRYVKRLSQGDAPSTYSFRILLKSGSVMWGQVNAALTSWEGRPATLCIIRDITRLRELEAQFEQSRKMEAIGTLSGGIAHDFNNILFPITGFAEMMLDDTPSDSPYFNGLTQILKAAKRAKEIIRQILDFSRLADMEIDILDIKPVFKDVLKLIDFSLPSTIEIHHHIEEECGFIRANATQLHQVLMNLVTNAFHAMEETGGRLDIDLSRFKLDEKEADELDVKPGFYACLRVLDTGVGIEKAVLARIFDPYFTTKKTGKGTGLGLSVVHGIISKYGGAIRVNSEPGQGTEVKVYLPMFESASQTGVKERTANELKKGHERVLLVDDEQDIVEIERKMLKTMGYDVTVCTGSLEALEMFRNGSDRFDLVITDMTMPKLTGLALSRKLLEIRPDLPIIICTGYSEQVNDETVKEAGIRGFVMKPALINEFSKIIRCVLDNQKV